MLYLIWITCIVSLVFAGILTKRILAQSTGTKKMMEIADAIQVGSQAYLKRQFKTIGIISLVIVLAIVGLYAALGQLAAGVRTALAFSFGALCSVIAGYVGMWVAVRANIRTAAAAQKSL